MRRLSVILVATSLLLAACGAAPTPEPTPTATVEPTLPPTWTPTPVPTPTMPPPPPTAVIPPTVEPTATPVAAELYVTAQQGLNLRAEPSSTSRQVVLLKYGQKLLSTGQPSAPDANGVTWQAVTTADGQAGFVSVQFISAINPSVVAATAAPTQAAATPVPAAATPAPASGEAYVAATDGLNLRSTASATGALIAVLPFASKVSLLGAASAADAGGISWQNVRTADGKTGFVSAQFLSTTPPATATPTTVVTPTATLTPTTPITLPTTVSEVFVTAQQGLNLRAQAASNATLIAVIPFGQKLFALSARSAPDTAGIAWLNVRTAANQTGYVAADFVSATSPVTTTTPTTSTVPISATSTATAPVGTSTTALASDLFNRINGLRAQNELKSVLSNNLLVAAAARHSQDMAKTGTVSHTGSDGSLEQQRAKEAGYAGSVDEVVYGGRVTVDEVWNFWTSHKEHANVILNARFTEVGVSVINVGDRYYYTAVFGAP